LRPYALSFLKNVSKKFEIIAFTASKKEYADAILDEIDFERKMIHHRLYREDCINLHDHIYVKDLRIIDRPLSSMVLVDNCPFSYIYQLNNGIPILPYYEG
jgi:CTD small phosphatase-like protein 2